MAAVRIPADLRCFLVDRLCTAPRFTLTDMAAQVASERKFPLHAPTPAYYAHWRVYHEEQLATFYYGDGLSYQFATAADYVSDHYRYLADYMHQIWMDDAAGLKRLLVELLQRSTDYCTTCRVHCSSKTHFCHECLEVAPLFSAPAACRCVFKCHYSRPVMHARLLYVQKHKGVQ